MSPTSTVVQAGYYQETTLDTVDPDLKPENIKAGVTIFGITGTYGDINPTNGLIAYYPLDGDTLDYSGNSRHGTGTNLVVVTNGIQGAAYDFDGSSSFIRVSNYPELLDGPFTVVCWIKTTDDNRVHGPVSSTRAWNSEAFRILILDNGAVHFSLRIDYNQLNASQYPFASHLDQWTMVSTVYNETDARMYVNDQLVTVEPFAHGPPLVFEDFLIGAGAINVDGISPMQMFYGSIDEVRVYNRALGAEEINFLHDSIANP